TARPRSLLRTPRYARVVTALSRIKAKRTRRFKRFVQAVCGLRVASVNGALPSTSGWCEGCVLRRHMPQPWTAVTSGEARCGADLLGRVAVGSCSERRSERKRQILLQSGGQERRV